jgi:MOSC domain-containing protein YiiM
VEPPRNVAHVVSVNVGHVRHVEYRGRDETTAIFKEPTTGRVAVTTETFGSDEQADRVAHGGPDRVAYTYAVEDLQWWEQQLDRVVGPGSMGENLTTVGLDITNASIGEQWRIGSVVFEVAALRTPCFKLGIRMGIDGFSSQFARARRPGAYLRVVEPGDVGRDDTIDIVRRPDHGVTMVLVADAYHRDHSLAARLLDAPQLDDVWRAWAEETVAAATR